jgi:hypothetical protein
MGTGVNPSGIFTKPASPVKSAKAEIQKTRLLMVGLEIANVCVVIPRFWLFFAARSSVFRDGSNTLGVVKLLVTLHTMKQQMKKMIILAVFLSCPLSWAENVELSTGEVLEGKLLNFPKDVTVELSDGTKKTIPYLGINSIYKDAAPQQFTPFLKDKKDKKSLDKVDKDFEDLDATKGLYATPGNTFQTWKKAALAGDIDGMVDCYVETRKGDVKKDLKKLSKKTREEMKLSIAQTLFTPSTPYYQGEFAIMEVTWAKGLASQTQTLKFVIENNKDWKIVE